MCIIALPKAVAPSGAIGAHAGSISSNCRLVSVALRFWQPMNGRQKSWKLNVVLAKVICIALYCDAKNGGASGTKTALAVPVDAAVLVSLSELVPRAVVTVT